MNKPDTEKLNWSILVVIVIGTFMAILDSSIVNVALPKMMTIFNASADQIQWILTAYMLTLGVIMPISGFLGDTFGYKRTYIVALSLFIVGSVFCGMSLGVNTMIAARIIQALGGGIMQPLGMALLYQSFPRSKIGMVLGFWGIAAMAAPAIGPTLGGYLVEYANWRLIFYINLPIGLLNLFLAGMILKETPLIKGKHFDFVGIATSIIGLFCILLALSDGTKYGWSSPFIVGLLSTAFITLIIFVFNELQHPEPILDLRMFKNFLFTMSVIIGSLLAMGMFGAIFLIPMLLQNVLGQTAMKTGLIMFPAAIASGVMMPLSGKLFDKYGARGIVIGGLVLVTWTTYAMNGFNDLTPYAVMTVWLTIRGAGMGLSMMPVTTVGMNTVPPHLIGRASALSNVIRQVASSFGIAMFTTIMQHRQVFHFSNMAQSVNISSNEYIHLQATLNDISTSLGLGYGTTQGLGISIIAKEIGKLSMIQAIGDCFIVAAALCLVALVMSLFLKEGKKKAIPTEPNLQLK
ncbi:MAG: MFS transporter [Firmicutes bacterium HGW-Firmicutes-15]|nr:MAG: MFS transporter [Firmicutes bacterium HGW-Firmicutes-15]